MIIMAVTPERLNAGQPAALGGGSPAGQAATWGELLPYLLAGLEPQNGPEILA